VISTWSRPLTENFEHCIFLLALFCGDVLLALITFFFKMLFRIYNVKFYTKTIICFMYDFRFIYKPS